MGDSAGAHACISTGMQAPEKASTRETNPPTRAHAPSLPPQVREPSATVEHEASTSKIGEDQLFYFQQRGVEPEQVGLLGLLRGCLSVALVRMRQGAAAPPPTCFATCQACGRLWVLQFDVDERQGDLCLCSNITATDGSLTHPNCKHHHLQAVAAIISGFCREVFNELPLEFAAEVNELMSLKLEGTVG